MKYILYNIIFILETLFVVYANEELILLNDDNFEHLTQAATGATTGDWLVMMVGKGKCDECDRMQTVLKKVSDKMQGRLNVAKIDPENSKLTLRRFKIGKKPVLLFFRLGYQWQYSRFLGENDLVTFVTEGYSRENSRPVYKQLDRFDVWYEDFMKEMKASYKEKRLPERDALLVSLAGVFVGLIVIACMLSSRKKNAQEPEKKSSKQSKKRR